MKKRLILIFGFLILQLISSCKTHFSTTELNSHFSQEQIADLNQISHFFKEQVCIKSDADFRSCYEEIPHEYLEAYGDGFWTNINFAKLQELYDQISKSTFNEIWMLCETTYYPSKVKAKNICAVATGKYQNYLSDLGKRNPHIAKYAERIQQTGDFSGSDFNYREILNDKKSFDLKDPNIQLILAIHYLSLSDQALRNEKLQRTVRPTFD